MPKAFQITLLYVGFFYLLTVLMKLLSLVANGFPSGSIQFFLFSPVPSIRSWKQRAQNVQSNLNTNLLIIGLEATLLVLFYKLPSQFLSLDELHWWFQGYLAIVPFVLLIDCLGRVCVLIYGIFGKDLPHIHRNFLQSKNLSEFWRRWNQWFADWLYETCFRPFIRRPYLAMFTSFLASGLFHEYLVNVPFYQIYGKNLIGSMLIYFGLQGFGFLIGKTILEGRFYANLIWSWAIIVIPAPFVINEGTLRIFHLGFFG